MKELKEEKQEVRTRPGDLTADGKRTFIHVGIHEETAKHHLAELDGKSPKLHRNLDGNKERLGVSIPVASDAAENKGIVKDTRKKFPMADMSPEIAPSKFAKGKGIARNDEDCGEGE
jgi:hypothetical protein